MRLERGSAGASLASGSRNSVGGLVTDDRYLHFAMFTTSSANGLTMLSTIELRCHVKVHILNK